MGKKEKKSNIMLIGFMGSGKSTLGIRLSYKLKLPVKDTDKIIEEREKMPVSEIFKIKGEGYFRKMETALLTEIASKGGRSIYSLGGGTPLQLQNQGLICKCGKVFYLKASPETIYERLKGDTTRPLLMCDDPYKKIKELIEYRSPIYERCADHVICVDDKDQSQILDEILKILGEPL